MAAVALLTVFVGNIAMCAGWQATPEARMACCMNSATCPAHKSDSPEHSPKQQSNQTQADSCCAASAQHRDSSAAGSLLASSGVMAPVQASPFMAPTTSPMAQEWRALVPVPGSQVPKHLLLSVLLV